MLRGSEIGTDVIRAAKAQEMARTQNAYAPQAPKPIGALGALRKDLAETREAIGAEVRRLEAIGDMLHGPVDQKNSVGGTVGQVGAIGELQAEAHALRAALHVLREQVDRLQSLA